MKSFQEYLWESKEGKNVHLEHLEDCVWNDGIKGIKNSLSFLQSLRDMLSGVGETRVRVTTKWDGAPAIVCGTNPANGKFFVGTKGVFAKNAKLCYTPQDIDLIYPGQGGLGAKLKIALEYLKDLGIHGVVQGDIMFTHDTLGTEEIGGERCVIFRPNTITYGVPYDSNLAHQILGARIGVVFHTSYHGDSLETMRSQFYVDVGSFRASRHVWFRDADFTDVTGTAKFTATEAGAFKEELSAIGKTFGQLPPGFINRVATTTTFKTWVKQWNNLKVRDGQQIDNAAHHVAGFCAWLEGKLNQEILDAKKPETKRTRTLAKRDIMGFFNSHRRDFVSAVLLYNAIVSAKLKIVRKLETIKGIGTFLQTPDGYKVTAPEGFVAVDHEGSAIKLVDRLTFSQANFTATKNWKG